MPKVTEAHIAARRQQIIDAAYRCFARRGFHQTTMREIYEEAQLSPGAVYHYFDGKDAIIRASFEFDYQRSQELFAAALADDDPLHALHGLIDFFFHGLQQAAALGAGRVNVQGWGEALINPAVLDSLLNVLDSYLNFLSQLIRRAQELGQVDPAVDSRTVGRMLLSLYYGLELQKSLDPEVNVDAYVATVTTLIFPLATHTES